MQNKFSTLSFIFAFVIFLSIIFKKDIITPKRYLYKNNKLKITTYSFIAGFSSFLFLHFMNRCNLSTTKFMILFILFLAIVYIKCKECHKSYQIITVYQYFIPILILFNTCTDLKKLMGIIAFCSALGRLGCMSAGCCHGKIVDKEDFFCMKYPDPDQLINKKNNTKSCYAKPTIKIEALIQFVIAGLCFRFPDRSLEIYGILTAICVYLSTKWRNEKRDKPELAYIGLALLPILSLFCSNSNNLMCNIKSSKNQLIFNILFSIMTILIYSNDIQFNWLFSLKSS